jgi:hypothetical protein
MYSYIPSNKRIKKITTKTTATEIRYYDCI